MTKRIGILASVLAVAIVVASLFTWAQLRQSTSLEIAPSSVVAAAGSSALEPIETSHRNVIGDASATEAVAHQGARDWAKEQRDSKDYFEFISKALAAVEAGDGRAAYHIGDAVLKCISVVRSAKQHSDFEERYKQQQAQSQLQHPQMPLWARRRSESAIQKCIRLAKEDPFGELPPIENDQYKNGYYSIQYWQDRAIELGDPVAKADRTAHLLSAAADGKATSKNRESFERAESYLQDVLRSKDPLAVFMIGSTLISGRYSADPSRGVVLTLAACEMGLDCSGRTPLFPNDACGAPEDARPPECGAFVDYRDTIQRDAGAARYARLYAQAQEIVEQVRREDWDALKPYMEIDGSLRKGYPPGE